MPLWLIYHTPDAFTTTDEKAALAKDITSIYTNPPVSLPAFYVVVNFIPVTHESCFIGGVSRSPSRPFVRLTIDHIAVHNDTGDPEVYRRTAEWLNKILPLHLTDKGYEYEFHADETPRGLWMINGIVPPEWGSEGEKLWVRENQPVLLDL